METGKNKETTSKGIVGIFELFDQFFGTHIHRIGSGEIADYKTYALNLNSNLKKARQYSRIGKSLANEISQLLSKSDKLISSLNDIQDGFSQAREGLKGVSSLSEEAVTGIQAASDKMQESIDSLKKDLDRLSTAVEGQEDSQNTLDAARDKVDQMGDVAFNIVMELQFQDILRQRLSAVADILMKTRTTLSKGLENIAGVSLELPQEDSDFAVTDDSILGGEGTSQDDIDALFRSSAGSGESGSPDAGQDDIDAIINAAKKGTKDPEE